MADTLRYVCIDAAVAQPVPHGLQTVRDLTARFAQEQAVSGHHLDLRRRKDPRRRVHDGTEYAIPRKRSLLRLVWIDGLKRLIRHGAAEIMEEPPRDAVGAADDHGGRTDERAQGSRELRQDLRLHGKEHVVMNSEFRRRSGPRPALPYLAAPVDAKAARTQRSQGRPARQHRHRPSGAIESVADPGTDGARPHDGNRWTHDLGLLFQLWSMRYNNRSR